MVRKKRKLRRFDKNPAIQTLIQKSFANPSISLKKALQKIGYDNYKEYLDSPTWINKRRKYYSDSLMPKKCIICKSENKTYNTATVLHHLNYENLGNEKLSDFIPLCVQHHNYIHKKLYKFNIDKKYSIELLIHLEKIKPRYYWKFYVQKYLEENNLKISRLSSRYFGFYDEDGKKYFFKNNKIVPTSIIDFYQNEKVYNKLITNYIKDCNNCDFIPWLQ